MFERFTQDSRRAVIDAQVWARRFDHDDIGAAHLLVAISHLGNRIVDDVLRTHGVAAAGLIELVGQPRTGPLPGVSDEDARVLKDLGIDVDQVAASVRRNFGTDPIPAEPAKRRRRFRREHLPFSTDAKGALEDSLRQCLDLGDNSIRPAYLLLALLGPRQVATRALVTCCGADPDEVALDLRRRLRDAA